MGEESPGGVLEQLVVPFLRDCPRKLTQENCPSLEAQTLSEGVVDTARPPQCEFSYLQNLPVNFFLEFVAGRSWTSVRLVLPRAET